MALLPPVPGRVPELAAFAPASIVRSGLRGTGAALVVERAELLMILDLHRQGPVCDCDRERAAIPRRSAYIERGLEPPPTARNRWATKQDLLPCRLLA
ncbi:hypothetical protein MPLA_320037 [Mesorhizobium sp. ORS 3359]|nr:hypothetical protein MPLA_320037 [Mesorhizobium sp. ORS 3359]